MQYPSAKVGNPMKGPVTRWACKHCDQTLTTYIKVSEPPTHRCAGQDNTIKTGGLYPMIPKGNK